MNSRVIKFRVWREAYTCPYTQKHFSAGWAKSFDFYLGQDGRIYENDYGVSLCDGDPKLTASLFTGLKDSKGVDIYEGDILSYKEWDGRPFVVRWGMHHGNHSVGYVYGFSMPDRGFGPWEVIGNIFEHSHLIK